MFLKRILLVAIVLSLFLCVRTSGAKESELFYATPYLGYHFFDAKRDLRSGVETGFLLERMVTDNFGFEAGAGPIFTMKLPDNGQHKKPFAVAYRLNGNYYFPLRGKILPYLTGGSGGDIIPGEGNTFGIDAGLGLHFLLPKNRSVRAEMRAVHVFESRTDWVATFGFSLPLGHKDSDKDGVENNLDKCPGTPAGVQVDARGCPIDSDRDGVPDYLDKCASTPAGVKTDASGCPLDTDSDGVPDYLDKCPSTPADVKVDASGCPLDTDGDGVPDYLDKCPGTPAGAKTDVNGCPLDSDSDGVPDYLDKCPGTPAGTKVDASGCAIIVAPKLPRDYDGDGVPDDLDKCPNTPAGVKVDGRGCPIDTDADGVPDYLDKCPGTPVGARIDASGCPIDTDADGVPDYLDKCPGTPAGARVDVTGCTVTVAPKDFDNDGVPDDLDKCPNTPAGVQVDARGCPIDSDADGVPDYLDKCPNSPVGARVDQTGCVISVILNVKFDSNMSVLKEQYYPEIQRFADFMNNDSSMKVEIQGHTDDTGVAATNMKLSGERAVAVMKVLVEKFGVPQARVSAQGYGSTKPIDTNKTPEGRTRNRRVEAVILK